MCCKKNPNDFDTRGRILNGVKANFLTTWEVEFLFQDLKAKLVAGSEKALFLAI